MKKTMMRILLPLLASLLILSACNTVQGIGKDVQSAGRAIDSGAQKVKRKIND